MEFARHLDEPLLANMPDTPYWKRFGSICLLLFTILFETTGTLLLKRAFDGYGFMIGAYVCYFASLTMFSFVLRQIPLYIAYTTWCALGSLGVCVLSSIIYGEVISTWKTMCIVITIPCVVGLYVFP